MSSSTAGAMAMVAESPGWLGEVKLSPARNTRATMAGAWFPARTCSQLSALKRKVMRLTSVGESTTGGGGGCVTTTGT